MRTMIQLLASKTKKALRRCGKYILNFRRIICNLKETEPHEELYELDEEEDEILPEPSVENLTYIAREIKPVNLI